MAEITPLSVRAFSLCLGCLVVEAACFASCLLSVSPRELSATDRCRVGLRRVIVSWPAWMLMVWTDAPLSRNPPDSSRRALKGRRPAGSVMPIELIAGAELRVLSVTAKRGLRVASPVSDRCDAVGAGTWPAPVAIERDLRFRAGC